MKANRHRISKWEILRVLALTAITAIVILPFVWMILNSFKSADEVLNKNVFFPTQWHPENYILAWNAAPFAVYFKNSLLMALATVICQIITSSMAAYSFAKIDYKLNKFLFMVFLSSMMGPSDRIQVADHIRDGIDQHLLLRDRPVHRQCVRRIPAQAVLHDHPGCVDGGRED